LLPTSDILRIYISCEEDDNDNEAVEMAEATLVVQPKAEVEGQLKAEVLAEAVPVLNQPNNTVLRIVRVTDRVRLSVSSTIFFFICFSH
jgi:hypothetical protein